MRLGVELPMTQLTKYLLVALLSVAAGCTSSPDKERAPMPTMKKPVPQPLLVERPDGMFLVNGADGCSVAVLLMEFGQILDCEFDCTADHGTLINLIDTKVPREDLLDFLEVVLYANDLVLTVADSGRYAIVTSIRRRVLRPSRRIFISEDDLPGSDVTLSHRVITSTLHLIHVRASSVRAYLARERRSGSRLFVQVIEENNSLLVTGRGCDVWRAYREVQELDVSTDPWQ